MVAQIDKDYSKYGIQKVARRITSYAFFEGRPHTTKGQWFNPVVFGVLRAISAIPGEPEVKKPIFISGLGRSGTTILGVLLSLHQDIGFLNEPKAIWRLIDPRFDINADYESSGGVYRLGEEDVSTRATINAHRLFSRYLRLTSSSRLLDKYPELIFRTEYLLKMFPDAKIIFISRSGPDACSSIVNWSRVNGGVSRGELEDWWGRNDAKWHYLWQQLIVTDEYFGALHGRNPDEFNHENRAALEWIVTMREGMRYQMKYPESVISIQYENLLAAPESELEKLFNYCELTYDDNVIDFAKQKLYQNPGKAWPLLDARVELLFIDTMLKLGYDCPYELTRKLDENKTENIGNQGLTGRAWGL